MIPALDAALAVAWRLLALELAVAACAAGFGLLGLAASYFRAAYGDPSPPRQIEESPCSNGSNTPAGSRSPRRRSPDG